MSINVEPKTNTSLSECGGFRAEHTGGVGLFLAPSYVNHTVFQFSITVRSDFGLYLQMQISIHFVGCCVCLFSGPLNNPH